MPENLALMRLLAEQYAKTPFSGVEWMTVRPLRQGYAVNPIAGHRLVGSWGGGALLCVTRAICQVTDV